MEGIEAPDSTHFLQRALKLARKGRGSVSPNPLVGAVLVKEGKIIGEGFHQKYGEKHAEARAIEDAAKKGFSVEGGDLYCTLEPCCFTGLGKHQPPCTDLILRAGIARVFVSTLDPHPAVRGKGIQILQDAGVKVAVGALASEALSLNEGYFTYQTMKRPFLHLKIAQSIDGRIAALEGDSRWITNEKARRMVHRLRATYDAVLVGKHTVQVDDPELTVRLVKGRNPYRIVLDSHLELPLSSKIFHLKDPEHTIVITAISPVSSKKRKALDRLGVRVVSIPPGPSSLPTWSKWQKSTDDLSPHSLRPPLPAVLTCLADLGIRSILVEGGASVFTSFLREHLFDRITFFIAPLVLGKGIEGIGDLGIRRIAEHLSFERVHFRQVGNQLIWEGYRQGFWEELYNLAVPSSSSQTVSAHRSEEVEACLQVSWKK